MAPAEAERQKQHEAAAVAERQKIAAESAELPQLRLKCRSSGRKLSSTGLLRRLKGRGNLWKLNCKKGGRGSSNIANVGRNCYGPMLESNYLVKNKMMCILLS
jgi:hypothetical protein